MSSIYTPTRRRYSPDDPFLQEGNIALRAIWLKKEAESAKEIEMISEEESKLMNVSGVPVYCDNCHMYFPTTIAYELHYEAVHRHVCSVCHKIFPGSMWLRLHQDELHDVFKDLQKERGEKIYKCYVESCSKYFMKPYLRKLHLIDKHKYPAYFPFDIVLTGTMSVEKRRQLQLKKEKRKKKKMHKVDDMMEEVTENMSRLRLPTTITFGHHVTPSYRIKKKTDV